MGVLPILDLVFNLTRGNVADQLGELHGVARAL